MCRVQHRNQDLDVEQAAHHQPGLDAELVASDGPHSGAYGFAPFAERVRQLAADPDMPRLLGWLSSL